MPASQEDSNACAMKLAKKYKKPGIGGSDAHKIECVSMGYTILPEYVTCETELISLIRRKVPIEAGGTLLWQDHQGENGQGRKASDLFLLVLQ